MESGKILRKTFEDTIWTQLGRVRPEVVAGPRYGVDVSVVELPGGMKLASASDPASLIPNLGMAESAWLTVHLTANDIATTGHGPMYAQFVLNLPDRLNDQQFAQYWANIHRYCDQIGVAITGGHTGKVPGMEATVAGGVTMSVVAEKVLVSSNIKPGHRLILTGYCALSACAILAKCFPETVKELVGEEAWQEVCHSFWRISIRREAVLAFETGKAVAMHDVTEGGVVGAVAEMCMAGGCGAIIERDALPVPSHVSAIGAHFGFDPVRTLGSGALLIACEPGDEGDLVSTLVDAGFPAQTIGTATANAGQVIWKEDRSVAFPAREKYDPYWKAYFRAVRLGWQ